ncbi:hypothetical protein [Pseudomonas gorinensis]
MSVEWVAGSSWNQWPDVYGIGGRMAVESANNFSLNGFDARHGFQEMMQQPAQVSMTIDEGHQFITGLVKDYLQQAHPQFVKFR